jgi:hypothetical protein
MRNLFARKSKDPTPVHSDADAVLRCLLIREFDGTQWYPRVPHGGDWVLSKKADGID